MSETNNEEINITILGNPGNPTGEAGKQMLERMNKSHYEVTGWALDFLNFKKDDIVLDIGCGGGMTLNRLSKIVTNGKLYGLDHSEIAVKTASELNKELLIAEKMTIIQGSVERLPYSDNVFDKIITVESFYFWPNPVENLKEVFRVLKKNGIFMLVADIYGKDCLSEQTLRNIKMFNLLNPTPEEFFTMFERAGFSSIEIHTKKDTDWISVLGCKFN